MSAFWIRYLLHYFYAYLYVVTVNVPEDKSMFKEFLTKVERKFFNRCKSLKQITKIKLTCELLRGSKNSF